MTTTIDWGDPAARRTLLDRVGADEFNRLLREYQHGSTVAIVNGRPIRLVRSDRFGLLYSVDGLTAFSTLAEAETHARGLAPKGGA